MIEIKVTGIEPVARAIERLPEEVRRKIMSKAMKDAVQTIQEAAKNRARVGPPGWGVLREAIITQVRRNGTVFMGKVGVDSSVNIPVGTFTRGRRVGQEKTERPSRIAHLLEFGSSHAAPYPFLRPALDAQAKNALARLMANLNEALDAYVEKNGAIT